MQLLLGDVDQREVTDRRVGSVQHEEIGEIRHGDRHVGLGPVVPELLQRDPVAPDDAHRTHEHARIETRRQCQHVKLVQGAVAGAHARGLDALDTLGHQPGMRMLDGPVVVGRIHQPLAVGAVVRPQPLPQHRVLHAVLQVLAAVHLDLVDACGFGIHEGVVEALDVQGVVRRGVDLQFPQARGIVAQRGAVFLAEWGILGGHDPLRGALEVAELRDPPGQCRDDLHARGAVAHHAHAPSVERHRVIPARGVETGAPKTRQPLDLRQIQVVQHPGGGDHDIARVLQPGLGAHVPATITVLAGTHLLVEADDPVHTVLAGGALEVFLDFGSRRQHMRPVGIGLEGVGVGVGWHVAGETGVGVLAPGAADAIGLLVDHAIDARLQQPDAAEHPGHARAHHDHPQFSLARFCRHYRTPC